MAKPGPSSSGVTTAAFSSSGVRGAAATEPIVALKTTSATNAPATDQRVFMVGSSLSQ
jgi:hypothetical protein